MCIISRSISKIENTQQDRLIRAESSQAEFDPVE